MAVRCARQSHKSCRYLDGSAPKPLALRVESAPAHEDRALLQEGETSVPRNGAAACPLPCTPRPYRRRRAFQRCGNEESCGRSKRRNPPSGAHLRSQGQSSQRTEAVINPAPRRWRDNLSPKPLPYSTVSFHTYKIGVLHLAVLIVRLMVAYRSDAKR